MWGHAARYQTVLLPHVVPWWMSTALPPGDPCASVALWFAQIAALKAATEQINREEAAYRSFTGPAEAYKREVGAVQAKANPVLSCLALCCVAPARGGPLIFLPLGGPLLCGGIHHTPCPCLQTLAWLEANESKDVRADEVVAASSVLEEQYVGPPTSAPPPSSHVCACQVPWCMAGCANVSLLSWRRQLELVAESMALEDAMYKLMPVLESGRVTLDEFLKVGVPMVAGEGEVGWLVGGGGAGKEH
jgi:hypothetical protein